MAIMYGSDKIDNLHFGGEKIERVYWGSDLVYQAEPQGEYPAWVYALGTPIGGLKSDGGQYIETGFIVGTSGKTVIRAATTTSAGTLGLYGYIYPSVIDRLAIGTHLSRWFSGMGITELNNAIMLGQENELIMDRDNLKFTSMGVEINLTAPSASITSAEAFLFSRNGVNGSSYGTGFIGEVYEHMEFDSEGELLMHNIPFKTNDGELGVLDLISRRFSGNSGTGEFIELSLASTQQELASFGIVPTDDFSTNMIELRELGVS